MNGENSNTFINTTISGIWNIRVRCDTLKNSYTNKLVKLLDMTLVMGISTNFSSNELTS